MKPFFTTTKDNLIKIFTYESEHRKLTPEEIKEGIENLEFHLESGEQFYNWNMKVINGYAVDITPGKNIFGNPTSEQTGAVKVKIKGNKVYFYGDFRTLVLMILESCGIGFEEFNTNQILFNGKYCTLKNCKDFLNEWITSLQYFNKTCYVTHNFNNI